MTKKRFFSIAYLDLLNTMAFLIDRQIYPERKVLFHLYSVSRFYILQTIHSDRFAEKNITCIDTMSRDAGNWSQFCSG